MKAGKEKIEVVYLGRYNFGEVLSGPEKTAKRIFYEHTKHGKSCFIQYYFDGRKHGLFKKLFGKEIAANVNNSGVLTLGLIGILTALFKLRPKIIHIITFERFAVTAFLYGLFRKTNIIYNSHGIVTYENSELKKVPKFTKFKDKFCEKIFFKYSNKIIFHSETSIDIAEKHFKINENKSVILSHGIDEIFSLNTALGKQENVNLKIAVLQQSILNKSAVDFLNSCIEKINCNTDLFCIGKEVEINKSNPKVRITYFDKMNPGKLAEFYKVKDLFLSLNKYDTFSISTAEAMAAGLVPVITEETGISRYIVYGENGFTVKYGDSEKLAKLLNYLSADRNMIREISANAAGIYNLLTWQQVYETYNNIYTELLK